MKTEKKNGLTLWSLEGEYKFKNFSAVPTEIIYILDGLYKTFNQ